MDESKPRKSSGNQTVTTQIEIFLNYYFLLVVVCFDNWDPPVLQEKAWPTVADPGGPPLPPKISSTSCSFQAIFREKPLF